MEPYAKVLVKRILGRPVELARSVIGPRLGRLKHHAARPLRHLSPVGASVFKDRAGLPTIGIVTPSFQQGNYLAATIGSVLDQRYPVLQYLVQDGGSTDDSVGVLKAFGDRLSGWHSAPDDGQSHALNLGFSQLDSEIMAYLNSDDLLLPGALAIVGDYFRRHPEVDVVYGDRIIIDEAGQEIGNWRLPRHDDKVLSWADYIPQETLFWRRRAWDRAGGRIDETFHFAMDWDLILRLRDSGARFRHLPRFLGAFRVHTLQKTSTRIADLGLQEMHRLRRRALGYDPTRQQVRLAVLPYLLAHMTVDVGQRLAEAALPRPAYPAFVPS